MHHFKATPFPAFPQGGTERKAFPLWGNGKWGRWRKLTSQILIIRQNRDSILPETFLLKNVISCIILKIPESLIRK
jgi:hypothetical protein